MQCLPDQIDPVGGVSFPSSEALDNKGKTVFDIGAGFVFTSGKLTGGFAVNHLAEPELSSSAVSTEKVDRKYSMNLSADFHLKSNGTVENRSSGADYSTGRIFLCEVQEHLWKAVIWQ